MVIFGKLLIYTSVKMMLKSWAKQRKREKWILNEFQLTSLQYFLFSESEIATTQHLLGELIAMQLDQISSHPLYSSYEQNLKNFMKYMTRYFCCCYYDANFILVFATIGWIFNGSNRAVFRGNCVFKIKNQDNQTTQGWHFSNQRTGFYMIMASVMKELTAFNR